MKTLCKSDIGLVRATNQDACQCGTFLDGAVWALVCDGMGGANGGNIASRTALTEMETQLQEHLLSLNLEQLRIIKSYL